MGRRDVKLFELNHVEIVFVCLDRWRIGLVRSGSVWVVNSIGLVRASVGRTKKRVRVSV